MAALHAVAVPATAAATVWPARSLRSARAFESGVFARHQLVDASPRQLCDANPKATV